MLLPRFPIDGGIPMVCSISNMGKHSAYGRCSQPIHHFWDRAGPGKCANGDLVQIVPGAINCVIDFFIIMLVCRCAKPTHTHNTNSDTANPPALAAADHRFSKRSTDRHLRLRRIVSQAHDGAPHQATVFLTGTIASASSASSASSSSPDSPTSTSHVRTHIPAPQS